MIYSISVVNNHITKEGTYMKAERIAKIKRCQKEYDMSYNSPQGRPYFMEELTEIFNGRKYWSFPRFFTNVADLEAYRQNETKVTKYRVCIWHESCGEIKPELVYEVV